MSDIEAFKMADGTYISGRKALRDYHKEHGTTDVRDFKEEWAKKAEERKRLFTPGSGYDKERRRAELARNYKEFKTYGEFQRSLEKLRK